MTEIAARRSSGKSFTSGICPRTSCCTPLKSRGTRNDPNPARTAFSADVAWLAKTVAVDNPNNRRGVEMHLEIWELPGKLAHKIDTDIPLVSLALSPDGKRLAASDGFGEPALVRRRQRQGRSQRGRRDPHRYQLAAVCPRCASLYVAEHNGTISQWNSATLEHSATFKAAENVGATSSRSDPMASRALGTSIDALHFWDVKSGKMLSPTGVPAGFIDDVAFAPMGNCSSRPRMGTPPGGTRATAVKLGDLKLESTQSDYFERSYFGIGPRIAKIIIDGPGFARHRGNLGGQLTMSRSAAILAAAGSGDGVTLFDARTGKLLFDDVAPNSNGNLSPFSFFDDGNQAASVQQKKLRVWNTRTGRDLAKIDLPLRPQEQAFKLSALRAAGSSRCQQSPWAATTIKAAACSGTPTRRSWCVNGAAPPIATIICASHRTTAGSPPPAPARRCG